MTFEEIQYLGQVVAVLGIFGSLVFVGLQIRQNTAIARAQVHQQLSDTFTVYLDTLSNHSDVVFAGTSGSKKLEDLSDEQLLQFSFLMAGLFKIWENAYYQYKSGFLTEHNWDSNYKWMLTWFHMPGVQIWWRVRRDLFANEFQDFLEASRRPDSGRPLPEILREAAKAAAASE